MAVVRAIGVVRSSADPRCQISYRVDIVVSRLHVFTKKRKTIQQEVRRYFAATPPTGLRTLTTLEDLAEASTGLSGFMISCSPRAVFVRHVAAINCTKDKKPRRKKARSDRTAFWLHRLPHFRIGMTVVFGGLACISLIKEQAVLAVGLASLYAALLQYLEQLRQKWARPRLAIEAHPVTVALTDGTERLGLAFSVWNRNREAEARDVVFIARWFRTSTDNDISWLSEYGHISVDPIFPMAKNYRSDEIRSLKPLGGIWDSHRVGVMIVDASRGLVELNCLVLGGNLHDASSNFIRVYPSVEKPYMITHDDDLLWDDTQQCWVIQ